MGESWQRVITCDVCYRTKNHSVEQAREVWTKVRVCLPVGPFRKVVVCGGCTLDLENAVKLLGLEAVFYPDVDLTLREMVITGRMSLAHLPGDVEVHYEITKKAGQ